MLHHLLQGLKQKKKENLIELRTRGKKQTKTPTKQKISLCKVTNSKVEVQPLVTEVYFLNIVEA